MFETGDTDLPPEKPVPAPGRVPEIDLGGDQPTDVPGELDEDLYASVPAVDLDGAPPENAAEPFDDETPEPAEGAPAAEEVPVEDEVSSALPARGSDDAPPPASGLRRSGAGEGGVPTYFGVSRFAGEEVTEADALATVGLLDAAAGKVLKRFNGTIFVDSGVARELPINRRQVDSVGLARAAVVPEDISIQLSYSVDVECEGPEGRVLLTPAFHPSGTLGAVRTTFISEESGEITTHWYLPSRKGLIRYDQNTDQIAVVAEGRIGRMQTEYIAGMLDEATLRKVSCGELDSVVRAATSGRRQVTDHDAEAGGTEFARYVRTYMKDRGLNPDGALPDSAHTSFANDKGEFFTIELGQRLNALGEKEFFAIVQSTWDFDESDSKSHIRRAAFEEWRITNHDSLRALLRYDFAVIQDKLRVIREADLFDQAGEQLGRGRHGRGVPIPGGTATARAFRNLVFVPHLS